MTPLEVYKKNALFPNILLSKKEQEALTKRATQEIPERISVSLKLKNKCAGFANIYYKDGRVKTIRFNGCEGHGYDFQSTKMSSIINTYLSGAYYERVAKMTEKETFPYGIWGNYVSYGIGSGSIVDILKWLGFKATYFTDDKMIMKWEISRET